MIGWLNSRIISTDRYLQRFASLGVNVHIRASRKQRERYVQINSEPNLASVRLDSEISTRVARKTLDAQKQEGEAAVELIKSAAETSEAVSQDPSRLDVLA